MDLGKALPVRVADGNRPFSRENSRSRPRPARERARRSPGTLDRHDRGPRAPRQLRRGQGGKRQRVRYGGAARARPHLRHAAGTTAAAKAESHDPLPLDRRRCVRRPGSRAVRGAISVPEPSGRRDQPRCDRRERAAVSRVRRRSAPAALCGARPDGIRSDRRADGAEPARASPFAQLVDLAFPFSLYEQAPFVDRGIGAITLTSAGNRPPPAFGDSRLNGRRLAQIGRAAQTLLGSLDEGFDQAEGTSTYVYLGSRTVRGWAIVFVLFAALLPCLAVIVDLFARLRRRHVPLLPALRSYRSRLAFWIFAALLFELFSILGIWETGAARPLAPELSPGTDWPVVGLALFSCILAVAWLFARDRLMPRRPVGDEEALAGQIGRSPRARRHLPPARGDESVLASCSSFPRSTPGSGCHSCGAGPPRSRPPCSRQGSPARCCSLGSFAAPARPRPRRAVVPRRSSPPSATCPFASLLVVCAWSRSPRSWPPSSPAAMRRIRALPSARRSGLDGGLVRRALLTARRQGTAASERDRAVGPRAGGTRPRRPLRARCSPIGTRTSASAAAARTIMCDSRPGSGSSTGPSLSKSRRARTSSSRCAFGASACARRPRSKRGSGSAAPWSASSAGRTKSSNPTSADTGFPGQPEDEPPVQHAERNRLSGLHRNSPEDLLDAELGLDLAHEIVRPDRDAAGGDEHVGREPARERLAVGALVVGDRAQPLDLGARRLELRGEQQPVGLVDLSRLERLARPAQLAPRGEHGGPRPPRDDAPRRDPPPRARRAVRARGAHRRPPPARRGARRRLTDGCWPRRPPVPLARLCCQFRQHTRTG